MDLVDTLAELDGDPHLHAARLLVLISAFVGTDDGTVVEGLTKLAKLDLLLRYPVMLDRALAAKGRPAGDVHLQDHERLSVESEMVRYRFGPWDHRYREFLNILVAKSLVTVTVEGRKVVVGADWTGASNSRRVECERSVRGLCEAIVAVEASF